MPTENDGSTSEGATPGVQGGVTPGNNTNNSNNNSNYRGRNRRNFRRGTNNNNLQQQNWSNRGSSLRFEGREPSLKGHIYDFTGERNPDQWIRTTCEIKSYVGRTYSKFTDAFTKAIDELVLDDPVLPNNSNPSDQILF